MATPYVQINFEFLDFCVYSLRQSADLVPPFASIAMCVHTCTIVFTAIFIQRNLEISSTPARPMPSTADDWPGVRPSLLVHRHHHQSACPQNANIIFCPVAVESPVPQPLASTPQPVLSLLSLSARSLFLCVVKRCSTDDWLFCPCQTATRQTRLVT